MRPSSQKKIAISIIITGAALYFLLDYENLYSYSMKLRSADLTILLTALGIHFISVLIRSWRISVLLGRRWSLPTPAIIKTSTLHHFFNAFLPARAGELALPVLLNRWHQISYSQGAGALLTMRAFDLLVLLFFFSQP